jgi:uncharacterized protein YjbJ (UPF0337 family)
MSLSTVSKKIRRAIIRKNQFAADRKRLRERGQRALVISVLPNGDEYMDKDRIAGSANQAKGAIKEAAGKMTGDAKLQAEGAADKAKGKLQNAVGGAKDALRDATRD